MKIKYKLLFIFLGIIFCFFISSNVKASNDSLIIDGYDMSDVYNYFNKDDAFFITKPDSNYFIYVPNDNSCKCYCAIRNNSIAYFNNIFFPLEGNSYNFYVFDTNTLKFVYSWTGAYNAWAYNRQSIVYTSKGIYNTDHKTFYIEPTILMPTLDWTFDRQIDRITISSQFFDFNTISSYNLYYTTDSSKVSNYKNLPTMPLATFNSSSGEVLYYWSLFFDNYYINDNVTYYFILEDKVSGRISGSTLLIDFDLLNDYFDEKLNESLKEQGIFGEDFKRGIPTLNMNYRRHIDVDNNYYYEIYSQFFSKYNISNRYIAYYTNNPNKLENFSSWDKLNIASYNSKNGDVSYYYYFNFNINNENTTYYFVLYNKVTGQFGNVSSLTLNLEDMWNYSEIIGNDNNKVNTRFDNLIDYLNDRLGLLLYPFELIGDLFYRFYNIHWEEPTIKIPALYVPVFNQKLTNEFTYNFNDLLSIPIVNYLHDFYIICINAIIVFNVVKFAIKIFEEVFIND